jgi:tetratricopeptide (TPR) repeat protein
MEDLSLPWRLSNALISAVIYIWQMVWPRQLAVFYPHPRNSLPVWIILLSAIFLIAVSTSVVVLRRKRPYLFVGWFWYLVMLLPAIGIVQVGYQGHADRYTYLPLIGLFIAATWAIADWSFDWKRRREILVAASAMVIAVLVVQARIQTSYWRDSEVLWRHTLAVTSHNQIAHNNLATVLGRQGRLAEAAEQLKEALQADPTATRVNYNLAGALLQAGQLEEAITYYKKELEIEPDYANAENNLGHALLQAGRTEEAITHFRKFVQLRPNSATAHYNLAFALHQTRRLDEAIFHYEEALALKPDYPDARQNLEKARQESGL